jgi:hypothetical protein
MRALGFETYMEHLDVYLRRFRADQRLDKSGKPDKKKSKIKDESRSSMSHSHAPSLAIRSEDGDIVGHSGHSHVGGGMMLQHRSSHGFGN